jgi:pimeloyl-ACP methyl ester carboxylesterase
MRDRKDYTARIRSFQLPSLVIGAESDHFVKSEHSRFMGAALENGTCLVVPGAGHLVNLEKPGEFNRCLLDFLSRLTEPMQRPGLLSAVA